MTHTIVCVVGTRPEAIKMAPVVLRLRAAGPAFRVRIVTTGQHRALLDRGLDDFGLEADRDLALMRNDQSLADLTGRALGALAEAFASEQPELVLAQGDTTSVFCSALACYYGRIPFGHVEAGLRTRLPYAPFPEEKNRELASHLAELHFAPTIGAKANLLREGIAPGAIHVTGNTVIDALRMTAGRADLVLPIEPPTERFVLVTAHRREHFGGPLEEIMTALRDLVERNGDLSVVFPVHPNPNVKPRVEAALGGHPRIRLLEPVGYREFVALMKEAHLVLTDSGGVQEEAPALGKPVILLREATERPEAVAQGSVTVAGPNRGAIVAAVEALWRDPERYARQARTVDAYGDGWAAERIARVVADRLDVDLGPPPAEMPDRWPAGAG